VGVDRIDVLELLQSVAIPYLGNPVETEPADLTGEMTCLDQGGRSIDEVKGLLGHASIATTQIYVHASRARLEAAVASLPDVLDVGQ
jgi:hypothetical protein